MSALLTPRRVLIFGAIGAAVLLFSMLGQSSDETSAAVTHPAGERSGANRPASTLTADAAAVLSRLAHRSADANHDGWAPVPEQEPASYPKLSCRIAS